jgi:RNA polymerase sigma factor FliA
MAESTWVQEHTPMVHRIARDVANRYRLRRYLDDLVSLGFEGLLEARGRFDETRGANFSTPAWYRVRGAMLDGSRKMGWTRSNRRARADEIWVDHQAEQTQAVPATPRTSQDDGGRTSRLDELADDLDGLVQDAANIFILTTATEESWFDSRTATPEEELFQRELADHVRDCIGELDERSRKIVEMSFFEHRSLYEIADAVGLSVSWVSRLRSMALEKLRSLLPGELVP